MAGNVSSDRITNADLELGSEDVLQQYCDPCDTEGAQILADGFCQTCKEYLCGKCYKYHCKPKPMRHHILLDAEHMPKSKDADEDISEFDEKCLKHGNMPLKIYCKSHNDFGCIMCLPEEHKSCGSVSFIQDCAKGVVDSKEYYDFRLEMKTLQASFKDVTDQAESRCTRGKEIYTALNTSEATSCLTLLLEKIKTLDQKKDELTVNLVSAKCADLRIQLDQLLRDDQSEVQKFMNMKRGHTFISRAKSCLNNLQTDTISDGENEHLNEIKQCQTLLQNVNACFDIQTESDVPAISDINIGETKSQTQKKLTSIKVNSKTGVGVKHDSDDMDCRITGSAVLSDGGIALADFCNEAIKILFPLYNSNFFNLNLGAKPFDVTEVQPGMIAVTLPSQRKITILALEDWSIVSEISLSGPCYGIASNQNIFFVTIEKPPKVQVIDMNGHILKTFARNANNQPLFVSPWYLAQDHARERIYVTDRENDTLTCLDSEGKVVKVFKSGDMTRPYGVAVDNSGMIYICSRRVDKLLCLDANFRTVKSIKDEKYLHKAESVAAWNKQDRLYIGTYRDDDLTVIDIQKN